MECGMKPTCLSRLCRLPLLLTLTGVKEQDGPDRESHGPEVVLCVGTPLQTNSQKVAKHHGAHLRGSKEAEWHIMKI